MGALIHEGITYQNDNFDIWIRQVTPALPIRVRIVLITVNLSVSYFW